MSASMGMGTEGRDESALGGGGLDFHYPHPYEVEIRTFHYMPGQVGLSTNFVRHDEAASLATITLFLPRAFGPLTYWFASFVGVLVCSSAPRSTHHRRRTNRNPIY